MFFIAEVVGEFGLHGAFENRFGELFKEAVFTEDIFGRLVVLEQLVNEVNINKRRIFGHSTSKRRAFTLRVYDRLHKIFYTLRQYLCVSPRPEINNLRVTLSSGYHQIISCLLSTLLSESSRIICCVQQVSIIFRSKFSDTKTL